MADAEGGLLAHGVAEEAKEALRGVGAFQGVHVLPFGTTPVDLERPGETP